MVNVENFVIQKMKMNLLLGINKFYLIANILFDRDFEMASSSLSFDSMDFYLLLLIFVDYYLTLQIPHNVSYPECFYINLFSLFDWNKITVQIGPYLTSFSLVRHYLLTEHVYYMLRDY